MHSLFSANPEIDADCRSLQQRLLHYLDYQYGHTAHESLGGRQPSDCFQNDTRALRFAESIDYLRQKFVLHITRRVSFDNVAGFDGIKYEVPTGHAGTWITLYRNMLDQSIRIADHGKLVRLFPVDLNGNAHDKRATGHGDDGGTKPMLPKSCSQIAYERDFAPVVDSDGGFTE